MENISDSVKNFLEGKNPLERVINIECGYDDDVAFVIYKNEEGKKFIKQMDFLPFLWAKNSACVRMFDGNRKALKTALDKFQIGVKRLKFENEKGETHDRLVDSFKYMFYAKKKMSWSSFQRFFQIAKTPIYPKKSKDPTVKNDVKEFLAVSPIEQFMIKNSIRLFKGYEDYDELKRFIWDIETTGLNPEVDVIDQIGIRTNKGFETIITVEGDTKEEKEKNEINAIRQFLEILAEQKSDIVVGHNSENFDWNFLMVRCKKHGIDFGELSNEYYMKPIYKKEKESVLKLGGEVEYFKPTIMWGTTILDSMHAVRRAQATDSDIKSANLKYVTKYLKLKKENRVYVKGDKIGEIWREQNPIYAFNDNNGEYYLTDEKHPLQDGYELVTGKYIVERYLLDDIWETDKVELTLNQANFLISKIIPTSFQRAATMGTAGIWKLIMLAWCFENNLAIPSFTPSHSFTGGLSRLLKTGYADNVAKLDYNSLYPSIMLTWWVRSCVDSTDSLLHMLNYVLTNREKYKGLKGAAGKEATKLKDYLAEHQNEINDIDLNKIKQDIQHFEAEKNANDKKQNPLKVLGNSVFGSFGSPQLFPFGDQQSAEFVTCVGRQCLRLMISHFKNLGYEPIVGDSVLGDTPLFIKYKDSNLLDIKPIEEIFDNDLKEEDILGRQYDLSKKNYQVLCRNGWSDVKYVYKHNTSKDIYEINDNDMIVECTEDHSLFDSDRNEIKPCNIKNDTKLEYYTNKICGDIIILSEKEISLSVKMLKDNICNRLNYRLLNMNQEQTMILLKMLNDYAPNNKTCLAQINYLKNKIND